MRLLKWRKNFRQSGKKKALVFGAGDAAELLVKHLQGRGLREVVVTNRHPKRAEELARKFDGTTLPFHEAVASAEDVDVFITATGATQYIVKAWDVRNLMMKEIINLLWSLISPYPATLSRK